jgi:hypothetical protein
MACATSPTTQRSDRFPSQPGPEQPHLQRRRVLELVDEEVAEPPALRGGERRVGFDRVCAPPQEVVEVATAPARLLGFVARVDLRHASRGDRQPSLGARGGGDVCVGTHHARLGPLDLGRQVRERGSPARRACRPGPVEHCREHACLRAEDRRRLAALLDRPSAQLGECQRVEGPRGDARDPERREPVDELARGVPGERHREHVAGLRRAFPRAVRDATGQDAGLAGPGGREDGERVRVGDDRVALACVESVEQRIHRRERSEGLRRSG